MSEQVTQVDVDEQAEGAEIIARLPESVLMPIGEIQPYWRNPRKIGDDAVEAVRRSIELYGYAQPIVVDSSHVIVVGHTRLQALQLLGYTEVPVYVTDLPEEKAREYRLVDNRVSEMTSWDHASLVVELREWEDGLLAEFFPDMNLEIESIQSMSPSNEDVANAVNELNNMQPKAEMLTTEVECPACGAVFDVSTASLPGLTQNDLGELQAAAKEAS